MSKQPSKIKMQSQINGDTAEITIEGEIGWGEWDGEKWVDNTSASIRRQLEQLMNADVSNIVVNIHSLGGYVDDALAIHDALAMHPATVETRVTGFTASAATIIAQAGSKRTISANAMYLVHEAWGWAMGTQNEMMESVEMLDTLNDKMADLYARRAGGKKEDYRNIMAEANGNGKWMSAERAKELGFVDEVIEPMKAAAAVRQFNFAKALGLDLPDVELPDPDIDPEHTAATTEIEEPDASESGVDANQYSDLLIQEAELLT